MTPDFRAGVDHRVRRQRMRALLLMSPAIVVLLLGAALLVPRGGQDTTLQVTGGGSSDAPQPTNPATTPTTTVAGVAGATTATTVAGSAEAGAISCGTVAVNTLDMKGLDRPGSGPFGCFLDAFNANRPADLTITVEGPGTGALTERLTLAADHTVTVAASGSLTVQLPAFNLGGGQGGLYPRGAAGGDCGSITIDLASSGGATQPDARVMQCLMGAFTGSGAAHLIVVMRDEFGGTMTSTIDVSTAHVLSVSLDGTSTVKLPNDLRAPEEVLKLLPSGPMGLGGIMSAGGLGGLGGAAAGNPAGGKPNG